MREDKPRIFLVEDEPSARQGLAQLLQSRDYRVVTFASAEEFLDAKPAPQIACLILDVRLPGLNGFELQACLVERGIFLPILFITAYGDVPMAVRALRCGAAGFLKKPLKEQQLVEEVERALAVCKREFRDRSETSTLQRLYQSLTAREAQVLAFVTSGRLNKQTAAELGVVENTVKVHRRRIMRKMHAGSLAELVLMAQKLNLLPQPSGSAH